MVLDKNLFCGGLPVTAGKVGLFPSTWAGSNLNGQLNKAKISQHGCFMAAVGHKEGIHKV